MQAEQHCKEDSDSEDDPDYVPTVDVASGMSAQSDSADEERDAKRVKTSPPKLTVEEEAEKKRARDEQWASFQASILNPAGSTPRISETKLVKIEKRYRYAGEEVTELVEVPESSEEAKKWPLWEPSVAALTPEEVAENSESQSSSGGPSTSTITTREINAASSSASVPSSSSMPPSENPSKRPGPRKPKTKLAPLPEIAKAKKLTTLDKSAMDWRAHVSTTSNSGLKDELQAHRRGGGYLEKVEFLQRVEERKDHAFEVNKSTKRRRG
ncbi:bucentaur or craniofacial development-domain-containing protein [Irpex rosettiformis]|uniref:Bucentaur or craniofacial development-domain-containing protein n=1 Tax=Irpex rosettiformis TaxID=378272 RepID=A0ACB8U1T7_9APHY|nr:bucentaur or craniofacial development-domain-containing protein [Irpex rosettiformis]